MSLSDALLGLVTLALLAYLFLALLRREKLQ